MTEYQQARARYADLLGALASHLERRNLARRAIVDNYSINEVVREYDDLLLRLIVDAGNGNLRRRPFVETMQQAIIDDARLVYLEGMSEGGIKDPEEAFDDDDDAAVKDWILSQTPHVGAFVDDAIEVSKITGSDEREAARNTMLDRREAWVNALNQLGRLGYANALGDPMLTFEGDDGKESCKDCQKYKGQRHKKSWWNKKGLLERNGNQHFECGRWDNCQHNYYYDDGSLAL